MAEPAPPLHLLVVGRGRGGALGLRRDRGQPGLRRREHGRSGRGEESAARRAADILLVNLPAGSNSGAKPGSGTGPEVKLLYPDTSVIAMTATGSVNAAVEAMRCAPRTT